MVKPDFSSMQGWVRPSMVLGGDPTHPPPRGGNTLCVSVCVCVFQVYPSFGSTPVSRLPQFAYEIIAKIDRSIDRPDDDRGTLKIDHNIAETYRSTPPCVKLRTSSVTSNKELREITDSGRGAALHMHIVRYSY
jgi:hypothetical protein